MVLGTRDEATTVLAVVAGLLGLLFPVASGTLAADVDPCTFIITPAVCELWHTPEDASGNPWATLIGESVVSLGHGTWLATDPNNIPATQRITRYTRHTQTVVVEPNLLQPLGRTFVGRMSYDRQAKKLYVYILHLDSHDNLAAYVLQLTGIEH